MTKQYLVDVKEAFERSLKEINIVGIRAAGGMVNGELKPDKDGNYLFITFNVPAQTAKVVIGFQEVLRNGIPKKVPVYDWAPAGNYLAKIRRNDRGPWVIMPVKAGRKDPKTGKPEKYYDVLRFESIFVPEGLGLSIEVTNHVKMGVMAPVLWLVGWNLAPNPDDREHTGEACNVPSGSRTSGCQNAQWIGTDDTAGVNALIHGSQSIRSVVDDGNQARVFCITRGMWCDDKAAEDFTEWSRGENLEVERTKPIVDAGGLVIDKVSIKKGEVVVPGTNEVTTRWKEGLKQRKDIAQTCPWFLAKRNKSKNPDAKDMWYERPSYYHPVPCCVVTTQTFTMNADGTPNYGNAVSTAETKWEYGITHFDVQELIMDKAKGLITVRKVDTSVFGVVVTGGYRIVMRGCNGISRPDANTLALYKSTVTASNDRIRKGRENSPAGQVEALKTDVETTIKESPGYTPDYRSQMIVDVTNKFTEVGTVMGDMSPRVLAIYNELLETWGAFVATTMAPQA